MHDSTNLSKVGSKFVELNEQMEAALNRVRKFREEAKLDEEGLQAKLPTMVEEVQRARALLSSIGTSLGNQRSANVFISGRKVDSDRQASEARHRVKLIKETANENGGTITDTHPLDYESEKNRRKFAAIAIGVVGQMEMAKKQTALLETSNVSPEVGPFLLAQSIVDQYQRTTAFKCRMDRIEKKLNETKRCIPLQQAQLNRTPSKGRTTYALSSAPQSSSKKQRMRPIPLAGSLSPKPSQTKQSSLREHSFEQWNDIAFALHNLGSEHASTVKVGGLSRLSTLLNRGNEKEPSSQRRVARSLLLSPTEKAYNTPSKPLAAATTGTSIAIFSPPSTTKARKAWDVGATLDRTKATQLSFALPNDLKEVTISEASRKTLAAYGTTPEKVRKSIDLKSSQSAARTAPRPQKHSAASLDGKVASSTKKVPAAAFPPMATKAPTNPFSQNSEKTKNGSAIKLKEGSSYPPLSAVAPKPYGSQSAQPSGDAAVEKTAYADKATTKPPAAAPGETNTSSASKTDGLGDMKGMGNSIFSLGGSASLAPDTSNLFGIVKSTKEEASQGTSPPDYKSILTSFYQTHNAAKVAEVAKTLEKYKGREVAMFQKLASKYKVQSPLDGMQRVMTGPSGSSPAVTSGFGGGSTGQSPFSTSGSATTSATPFSNVSIATTAASPFSSTNAATVTSSASPFASSNNPSGFGKPPASPFGAPASASVIPSQSPFGGASSSKNTLFGSGGLASTSPFGAASSMTQSSPFGAAAAPAPAMQTGASQSSLQSRTPREMLTQFYQQKNPSKLGEIDKVLAKYQGKEEQLFRNLAKKYQLDPSVFGLSSAPASAAFGSPSSAPTMFGQASNLSGGASPFGQSTSFGQPSTMGFGTAGGASPGHTFGSGIGASQAGSSFGSLAQAPTPSPFGAPASGGFGSPAPASGGFGAPAPAFGATSSMGFGGSSPFGAPRR